MEEGTGNSLIDGWKIVEDRRSPPERGEGLII